MTAEYHADDLTHLEGLEAVRKRPGMYIGSTDQRGVHHLLHEIIDNSTDEAVAGHGARITVTLHADGSVQVDDEGRGIPTGVNTKAKMSGVALALTKLHAGGKFSSKNYASSGGLHGVGSAVVNALSKRMDVTVRQGGQVHQMSFQYGKPGTFTGEGPSGGFKAGGDLKVTGKMRKGEPTGTSIRYWHDAAYFEAGSSLDVEVVRARLRNTAFLVPNTTYVLRDLTTGDLQPEEFHFPGGIKDMVEFLTPSADKPICDTVTLMGSGTYTENAADENGVMQANVERTMEIEIALRWGTGYDTTVECFTNTIRNVHGGTHRKGFERGASKALLDSIKGTRGLLKPKDPAPVLDDVLEGLTAVIHVRVPEPQFTSQTKDELSTAGVLRTVQTLVDKRLREWAEARKTKAEAKVVLTKIVDASRVRHTQKATKEAARRKTALEGASMPAKLVDCRTNGLDRSELFIVEGDSALGSARSARVAEYQALLPIRGKILNVQKASLGEALKNTEVASIIQTIGASSGRSFDVDAMRYGRIILMADADSDGSHIRCLLATLFLRYMRPIIEEGRLYTAVPPLFKITTKGKGAETIYAYTTSEMEQVVTNLEKAGKTINRPIPRFKGLGEMNADVLWDTTMNPAERTLRRITLADAEESERIVELAMGDAVEPRRAWLVDSFAKVDAEALDI